MRHKQVSRGCVSPCVTGTTSQCDKAPFRDVSDLAVKTESFGVRTPVPFPCRSHYFTSKTRYYVPSAALYVVETTLTNGFESYIPSSPRGLKHRVCPALPDLAPLMGIKLSDYCHGVFERGGHVLAPFDPNGQKGELFRSMSSIKRDVKKKVLPRPESRCFLEVQPTGIPWRSLTCAHSDEFPLVS